MKERSKTFFKYHFWIKYYSEYFLGADHKSHIKINKGKFPMSSTEMVAILLQNLQNPKSSHKKASIEKDMYIPIYDKEAAKKYLEKVMKSVIEKTVISKVKELQKKIRKEKLEKYSEIFCSTTDMKRAAATLNGLKVGAGDLNVFLESLMNSHSELTMEKIRLITLGTYDGVRLYDDRKKPSSSKKSESKKKSKSKKAKIVSVLSQKNVFKLWVNCCKRLKLVDESDFFEFFKQYQGDPAQTQPGAQLASSGKSSGEAHKAGSLSHSDIELLSKKSGNKKGAGIMAPTTHQDWWNHYFDENGDPIIRNSQMKREKRRGKKKMWRKRKSMQQ